jgi:hypothetical protein
VKWKILIQHRFFYFCLFILTANGFVPGGKGTTIGHNVQNNTPHSNKIQHTNFEKQCNVFQIHSGKLLI